MFKMYNKSENLAERKSSFIKLISELLDHDKMNTSVLLHQNLFKNQVFKNYRRDETF